MADQSASGPASGQGRKLPVLFIHDAAIGDFIATVLLVAMPNVDLRGIVIAAADCIPQPGIDAASRLQQSRRLLRLRRNAARTFGVKIAQRAFANRREQ